MAVVPAPAEASARPQRPPHVGGGTLLLADLRSGFMLLNEARYRGCERVLGVPRSQANLVTLVAIALLADATHNKYRQLLAATAPSPGELALGTAAVRQLMLGPRATATPNLGVFGALAAFAIGGRFVIPAAVRSVRGVGHAASTFRSQFARRYWYRGGRSRA